MARSSVEIELNFRDRNTVRGLKDAAQAARELEGDLEDAETAAGAIAKKLTSESAEMKAEIDATRRAIDALDRELQGVENVDTVQAVGEFKRLGLSAEEVEADAEQLARALREVGDVKTHAARQGFSSLSQAVDGVEDSSRRAGDVTRGFLGDTIGDSVAAQTGIGGVGEAVGQMVEGVTAGEIKFKDMVAAGAGLAGVALAAWGVSEVIGSIREEQELLRQRAEAWRDALKESSSVLTAIDAMVANEETFSLDQIRHFNEVGLAAADVAELLKGGRSAIDAWYDGFDTIALQARQETLPLFFAVEGAYKTLTREAEASNVAVADHAETQQFYAQATEETEGKVSRLVEGLKAAAEQQADTEAKARDLADATAEAAQEALDHEEALRREREEMERNAAALEDQIDARRDLADQSLRAADAEDDFAKALAETPKELDKLEVGSRAYDAVLRDVVESARDVADANLRVAESAAEADGRTLSAAQRLDLWNDSMLGAAATAEGPMRRAILDYIGEVNGIPSAVVTDIMAAIDRGDLAEAERLLDQASESRNAAITVSSPNAGRADQYLDHVARNRTANIHVTTSGVDRNDPRLGRDTNFYASGTKGANAGYAIVGEQGAELMKLDGGEQVYNADDTRRMVSAGGGEPSTVIVNMPSGTTPTAVAQALRRYTRIQEDLGA